MQTINNKNKAYTLIELVIVMMLVGIVFSVSGVFITKPIEAYTNVVRRAGLVDAAESALRRMGRDVRQALPNSIRVKAGGQALEMVSVVRGYRYRGRGPAAPGDVLDINLPTTDFNVLENFPAEMLGDQGYRAVIYNIGAEGATSDNPIAGANVYGLSAGGHVVTPAGDTITLTNVGNEGHVNFSNSFQFAFASPRQRIFFIDSPVTYLCNVGSGNITRYWNYAINETQPDNPLFSPLNSAQSALLTKNLLSCNFIYQPGATQRGGIVTIVLTIGSGTEQIRLLHQVGVNNVP